MMSVAKDHHPASDMMTTTTTRTPTNNNYKIYNNTTWWWWCWGVDPANHPPTNYPPTHCIRVLWKLCRKGFKLGKSACIWNIRRRHHHLIGQCPIISCSCMCVCEYTLQRVRQVNPDWGVLPLPRTAVGWEVGHNEREQTPMYTDKQARVDQL